jgi:hypothetical protein
MLSWLTWLLLNPPVRKRCPRCGRQASYGVRRLGAPVTCPLCGRGFFVRPHRAVTWWTLGAVVAVAAIFLTALLVERFVNAHH